MFVVVVWCQGLHGIRSQDRRPRPTQASRPEIRGPAQLGASARSAPALARSDGPLWGAVLRLIMIPSCGGDMVSLSSFVRPALSQASVSYKPLHLLARCALVCNSGSRSGVFTKVTLTRPSFFVGSRPRFASSRRHRRPAACPVLLAVAEAVSAVYLVIHGAGPCWFVPVVRGGMPWCTWCARGVGLRFVGLGPSWHMTGASIMYSVSGHLGGPMSPSLPWGADWGVPWGASFPPRSEFPGRTVRSGGATARVLRRRPSQNSTPAIPSRSASCGPQNPHTTKCWKPLRCPRRLSPCPADNHVVQPRLGGGMGGGMGGGFWAERRGALS